MSIPVAHRLAHTAAQIQALHAEYSARLSEIIRQQAALASELPFLVPGQTQRTEPARAWKKQKFDDDLVVKGGTTVDGSMHITGVHAAAEPGQAMQQMGALRAILREQRQEVTQKLGLAGGQPESGFALGGGVPRAAVAGAGERKRSHSARCVSPVAASARGGAKTGKVNAESPLSLSPLRSAGRASPTSDAALFDESLDYSHLDDAELFDFLAS